jgi:hypothetical protein
MGDLDGSGFFDSAQGIGRAAGTGRLAEQEYQQQKIACVHNGFLSGESVWW